MTSEQKFKIKREEEYLERMVETKNRISPLSSDSFCTTVYFSEYEYLDIRYLLPIDEKDSIINRIKTLVLQTLDSKIAEQTGYINQLKQEYGKRKRN